MEANFLSRKGEGEGKCRNNVERERIFFPRKEYNIQKM